MKSIVLLSSGLDSLVAFMEAYNKSKEILCLTFDYGQRANKKEIEHSKAICEKFNIKHEIITLPWYSSFKGSLTNKKELPKISLSELDIKEIAEKTAQQVWVPARNVVFLSIAASMAENYDFDTIVTGFDKEEAQTFPDNSLEFVERFNEMLKYGTLKHPVVFAPLISMNKTEIVKRGFELNAPFELSWSCYENKKTPCKVCESCIRRERAFKNAQKKDPYFIKNGIVSEK